MMIMMMMMIMMRMIMTVANDTDDDDNDDDYLLIQFIPENTSIYTHICIYTYILQVNIYVYIYVFIQIHYINVYKLTYVCKHLSIPFGTKSDRALAFKLILVSKSSKFLKG
jgi:hypothetical protein